jgi:hypothetical protein
VVQWQTGDQSAEHVSLNGLVLDGYRENDEIGGTRAHVPILSSDRAEETKTSALHTGTVARDFSRFESAIQSDRDRTQRVGRARQK